MKSNLQVLLWKMSSAGYGTDPVPTASANALSAENVDINPAEMELDDYRPVRTTYGAGPKIINAKWCTMSFGTVLRGGGTPVGNASAAPNFDPVLRACGMARTVAAGTSITYSPIDSGEEDAAMYYYVDGVRNKMLGIRGNARLTFAAMKAPRLLFTGLGVTSVMVDDPMPTPTLPSTPRPLAVSKANTTLMLDSYALCVSNFELDLGNDVQYRGLVCREDIAIGNRESRGKVTFELPLVAQKNFLGAGGICTDALVVPLTMVHGSTPGNIVTVNLPQVQLLSPKPKSEKGIYMLECDMHVVDNQMTVAFT
jgi:hypothetical protein